MKTRAKKRRRDTVLGDLDPNLQTKRARRRTQLSFENSYGLCDNNWILEPKPPPLPTARVNAPIRPNGPVRWDDGSQETIERRTREQARGRAARGARRGHSVEPLTPTPPQPQPPPSSDFGSDIEFDFDFVPPVSHSFVSTFDWADILAFHEKLEKENMEYCPYCKEEWFNMELRSDTTNPQQHICDRCNRDRGALEKSGSGKPMLYSAENNMDPGVAFQDLPELTQVEEMSIALVHVHLLMMRVRGHQYSYSGHCVSFIQNTAKLFNVLPVLPEELDVVLLTPPVNVANNPRYTRQFQREFRVRRNVVLIWLRYLKRNHRDYSGIVISDENLARLPEDGDVSDRVARIVDDSFQELGEDAEREGPPAPLAVLPDGEGITLLDGDDLPAPPTTDSMIPNLHEEHTELEKLNEALRERIRIQGHAPAPSFSEFPVDEWRRTKRIFAMAFPSLYPNGVGDPFDSRARKVGLKEYGAHMLRLKNRRFGQHPRFRFLLFNMYMRGQANNRARWTVDNDEHLDKMSLEQLQERLQESESLLSKVVRSGASLLGTRPFWRSRGADLEAHARGIRDASPVFVTFSCADMQWDDLQRHLPRYDEWRNGNARERTKIVWENVQKNPHIVAEWLDIRFCHFLKIVLKPHLRYDDYWYRFEWQHRGSGHIHGLLWIKDAPKMDMSTEELRAAFAAFWDSKITAFNPNSTRCSDGRNPASLPYRAVQNTEDQFAGFLNCFQQHNNCPGPACTRKHKETQEKSCRFFYPRPCFDEATVTKDINHKSWMFGPKRNQGFLNQCSPAITMGWMANTDIQPATTLRAVIDYVAKYCSKAEKASFAYSELQAQVLPNVSSRNPVLSFTSKMLNKLVGERDWSAQEICHIILGKGLYHSSRKVITFDCRPEKEQRHVVELGDNEVQERKSNVQRYKERCQGRTGDAYRDTTLLDFLLRFNIEENHPLGRRAQARVIRYFPRYDSNPRGNQFDGRVKLMLHHPFVNVDDLKVVDGIQYDSFMDL